jgi:hypothetical protein
LPQSSAKSNTSSQNQFDQRVDDGDAMQRRFLFIALIGGVIFSAASLLFSPWRATAAGPALYLVSPQGQKVSTPQIIVELWARDSTNLAAWRSLRAGKLEDPSGCEERQVVPQVHHRPLFPDSTCRIQQQSQL